MKAENSYLYPEELQKNAKLPPGIRIFDNSWEWDFKTGDKYSGKRKKNTYQQTNNNFATG